MYLSRGYSESDVQNIASNCAWYQCPQLQTPVYCLRVLGSFHKEARLKAEEEWLQAERSVKKKKGQASLQGPSEGQKALAADETLADAPQPLKSGESRQPGSQSAVVDLDLDLVDLLTDSDEEKQAELKKRKLSDEEKKAARAQAAAAKKAEKEVKKKRRQDNKKTANFASKACGDLLKAVEKTKTALAAAKKKNKSELLVQGLEAQLSEQQTWRKQYLKVVSDFTLNPDAELQCPLDAEALKAALSAGAELAKGAKEAPSLAEARRAQARAAWSPTWPQKPKAARTQSETG